MPAPAPTAASCGRARAPARARSGGRWPGAPSRCWRARAAPDGRSSGARRRAARAAVQDQRHVAEVLVDVGALELPVERVDERLHLLLDAGREAAARGLELERR